jgi:hypothetical protein
MAVEFDGKKITNRLRGFSEDTQKIKGYDVGFFKSSTYTDGTKVASIAAWNELGTQNIPERPFFRQGNKSAEGKLTRLVKMSLNAKKNYVLNRAEVDKMGLVHEGAIKEKITDLRHPPNAKSTIKQKGSDNPLIDTGVMRTSVTHEVIE